MGVQYWQGLDEALELNDVEVIIATVPPAGTIAARAVALADLLANKAPGKSVNIIASDTFFFLLYSLEKALILTLLQVQHGMR